ncbi:inositol monophosphatase [Alsobacter sp. SYSU M60028]|uniref:Inositol-1-monophosphatase n=1 Tax=Alsobacter ponti TaxID=2962936 RepID=A0ABT1LGT2_9HYPH|nr:inositol monophosphatase family protein [Alsobacter ponti]MCP8940161.1 inositol monophosphatase [Alsobacter ponti]
MIRSPLMTVMVDAVMKAAKGLRRDFGEVENLQVSRKGPGDFVSAADHRAETVIRESLLKARPDFGFVMEESGRVEARDGMHYWHLDPLDGTTNFLHGIPHFAISLGLVRDGVIVAGVVYDPAKDELFIAERGKGAYINNKRMRVAQRTDTLDAVFATGIPTIGRRDHPGFLKQLAKVMVKTSGVRRMGAAALDLAYVAAGRYDAYWEQGLNSWDCCAGALMVREAGGFVSDAWGKDDVLAADTIVCGNEAMHAALLTMLKEARSVA